MGRRVSNNLHGVNVVTAPKQARVYALAALPRLLWLNSLCIMHWTFPVAPDFSFTFYDIKFTTVPESLRCAIQENRRFLTRGFLPSIKRLFGFHITKQTERMERACNRQQNDVLQNLKSLGSYGCLIFERFELKRVHSSHRPQNYTYLMRGKARILDFVLNL